MKTQQVPASKVNAVYAGRGQACAGTVSSANCGHHIKDKPHLAKRRDYSVDTWTVSRATGTKAHFQAQTTRHQLYSLDNSKSHPSNECFTEKSVIAQPIFVFEKKNRPFKRPAEDPICAAENDNFISYSKKRARSSSFTFRTSDSQSDLDTLSQKRVRSSSFTILPTFPPSQPVKKNNIFMTSALLRRSSDITSTKEGSSSHSPLWNIIRPAILQPPPMQLYEERKQTCIEHTLLFPKAENKETIQLSEECSPSPTKNIMSSRTAERPCVIMNLSSPKTIGNHLVEDRSILNHSKSDFVFGENMVERVLTPQKCSKLHNEMDPGKKEKTTTHTEYFQTCCPHTKTVVAESASLAESAAAYIAKPTQKYLLNKVEVITGEEAEHNVLQINCKLYVFNKLSLSWTERGRGSLRLNDTSSNRCGMLQSRLVMRNQGSLRLILNTKLWPQMMIERGNHKSLCITAVDQEDCSVKVFLIQASSKDVQYLYAAIHHRLVALQSFVEKESDTNQVDTEPEAAFCTLICGSDDEEEEEITQVSSNKSDHSRWIRRQPVVCS